MKLANLSKVSSAKFVIKKTSSVLLILLITLGCLEISFRLAGIFFLDKREAFNRVLPEDNKKFRILAIGESTTDEMHARRDNVAAWPALLQTYFQKNGIPTRVYNIGQGGINSFWIAQGFKASLEKYKPHAVVSMMGINDMIRRAAFDEARDQLPWHKELKIYQFYVWSRFFYSKANAALNDSTPPKEELSKNAERLEQGLISAENIIEDLASTKMSLEEKTQFLQELAYQMTNKSQRPQKDWTTVQKLLDIAFSMGRATNRGNFTQLILFGRTRQFDSCFNFTQKLIQQGYIFDLNDFVILGHCIPPDSPNKNQAWKKLLEGQPYLQNLDEVENSTSQNYQYMIRTSLEKNISFVALQYPLRPIESLRKLIPVDQQKKIVLIANEENFKNALKQYKYEEIFTDRFANEFGHATTLGNRLIAAEVFKFLNPLAQATVPH